MIEKLIVNSGNPTILGVNKTENGYNFAFCSDSSNVHLKLYKKGEENASYDICFEEKHRVGSVYCVQLSGICFNKYSYIYEVDGNEVVDPYTKYVANGRRFGEDSEAGYKSGIESAAFDWEEDAHPDYKLSDVIIYKMHVRGFTRHSSSKVKKKGTFAGIVEKIPYLKDLGVNAIMLMPCFEFFEYPVKSNIGPYESPKIKKLNYWGYTDGLYFAPKYAYSCNCKGVDYTVEFKKLVKACHSFGIEVYVEMYFGKDCSIGLISDCVKHWVMEYHIDGINFCCDTGALRELSSFAILSRTKMFCNYWGDDLNKKYAKKCKNLANFNEDFLVAIRRHLKGDDDMLPTFQRVFRNNPDKTGNINFITNHTGFTLADLVSYDRKHNESNGENNVDGPDYNYSWNCGVEGKTKKRKVIALRNQQMKNAMILLLLSQGTPMILSGDEFANSQDGNNNPYCHDDNSNYLNWKNLQRYAWMHDFVKNIIEFRKNNKILHMDEELKGIDYLSVGYPDISLHSENAWYAKLENYNHHIGILLDGEYSKSDDIIYVAVNMHWEKHHLALPKTPDNNAFKVVFDTSQEGAIISEENRRVELPARSVAVLVAKKAKL